jgi:hypothetical protein
VGTNYYHHELLCDHCGNECVRHIGKSSAGWTFTFRGYEDVTSYRQWLEKLQGVGYIKDEYGEDVTLEQFVALVESKRNEPNNHALYVRARRGRYGDVDDYLDEDGHSFSPREFS